MKKRAVIIRAVCYLLMLAAVLAWPIRKIIYYDFPEIPPKRLSLPVANAKIIENEFNRYLDLGEWKGQALSAADNIPEQLRTVFVTLQNDTSGTIKPQKVYFCRKEIPAGIPFIQAEYIFYNQKNIFFSVSLGHFQLNSSIQEELKKNDVHSSAWLKLYPNGTFQIESLLINGKKF